MSVYKVKLSKEEKHSIIIAIMLSLVGYIIAMFTCPDVFARFGSLIVCIGVIFGVKGLPVLLDHATPIYENEFDKVNEKIEELIPEGHPSKNEIKEKVEQASLEMKRTLYAVKQRLYKIEGGVIIIGTIIWGFGDYVVYTGYLSPECY